MSLAPAAAGVLMVTNAVPAEVLPFFREKDAAFAVLVKYRPTTRVRPAIACASAVLVTAWMLLALMTAPYQTVALNGVASVPVAADITVTA